MTTSGERAAPEWCAGLALAALLSAFGASANAQGPDTSRPIPYVPTHHDTVKDMLWMAEVGTNDVVYDLGSGDGRVVIAAVGDFQARKAVGIEIDPELVRQSRENAARAGLSERVQFIQGDLFTNDLSAASVVVLYLGDGHNIDLRGRIVRSLKPGARIISHKFGMGEWPADKVLEVRTPILGMYGEVVGPFHDNSDVPHYRGTRNRATHDTVSLWVVPAPVAGVWRGKVALPSGERELTITLRQRLAGLEGSFQLAGPTNLSGSVQAALWGDYLCCHAIAGRDYREFVLLFFEGHARGDLLDGTLWVNHGQQRRQVRWLARRERAALTGTWEWPGPKDTPVQLRVERRNGLLNASYTDTNRTLPMYVDPRKPVPVDLYDFGGGFYFTLLLGRDGNSLRLGPDDGWVVGECVVTNNSLGGRIAFFSAHDASGGAAARAAQANANAWSNWEARRISP